MPVAHWAAPTSPVPSGAAEARTLAARAVPAPRWPAFWIARLARRPAGGARGGAEDAAGPASEAVLAGLSLIGWRRPVLARAGRWRRAVSRLGRSTPKSCSDARPTLR